MEEMQDYTAWWIEWRMAGCPQYSRDDITPQPRRGNKRILGDDGTTRLIFLLARTYGLIAPDEWCSIESWGRQPVARRREVMDSIYEKVFGIPWQMFIKVCGTESNPYLRASISGWLGWLIDYKYKGKDSQWGPKEKPEGVPFPIHHTERVRAAEARRKMEDLEWRIRWEEKSLEREAKCLASTRQTLTKMRREFRSADRLRTKMEARL